jgi:hypothetical protein
VFALAAACGADDTPTTIRCEPHPVYLNRTGATFRAANNDDSINNLSAALDVERTFGAWPKDEVDWRNLVECIEAALVGLPRLVVTETAPGNVPHVELVFTTSHWMTVAQTFVVPASCRAGHHVGFVFGNALPTSQRACHIAMQAFGLMTAQLSLGSDCHDFLNNAVDCSPDRAFVAQTVECVDASNQPAECRCGGATQNSYEALEAVFPVCP